ncbi:hypothetical protein EBBID32_27880 [Sphingobium indicum BiD32]|uniref:Uncharacterized protein n=1 Tax=Sphingobium indicum BiD32 TaxID=1301087 RepID=N1MMJ0_9SPHN|nr:hypothetical protein EBBID32_27880 [Sphingobium indicum BiD32]
MAVWDNVVMTHNASRSQANNIHDICCAIYYGFSGTIRHHKQ